MKRAWLAGGLGLALAVLVGCNPRDTQPDASAPAGAKRADAAMRASPGRPGQWWTSAAAPAGAPAASGSLDAVFGHGGSQGWGATAGEYAIADDAALGLPVLTADAKKGVTLESRTRFAGGVRMTALLRLSTAAVPGGAAAADLYVARKQGPDPKDAAKQVEHYLRLYLPGAKASNTVNAGVSQAPLPFHDMEALTKTTDWSPQVATSYAYHLRAFDRYLPGWPEDFRAQVEHDMAGLPALDDKWLGVRIELSKGLVRFWVDDRVIAWKADDKLDPEGTVKLTLTPGAQLAAFRVEPIKPTPGYLPIELGGYANARGFLASRDGVRGDALPGAGEAVAVDGVPFVFPGVNPEGNDHIDVGRSLLRQGNSMGYIQTEHGELARWPGSASRDPARIQVRVPNGQYDALHLIAAADGETHQVPIITAMFFRPGAGFARNFAARVPEATAKASGVEPLPVTLANGKKASLYHVTIPLDPGQLSSFADMDVVEIELTKGVELYRSYPDPISYGWHQSGLPSSVHVFAATLQEAPVGFEWKPDVFGHVWTAPANPAYTATVVNRTGADAEGKLTIVTRSHDGAEETKQDVPVKLAKDAKATPVKVNVPVKLHGYHDITATLSINGKEWTEKRSLVKLAPDARSARWTPGRGAMFGYWSYGGGHHTPNKEHHIRLMTLAGARGAIGVPSVEELAKLPPDVAGLVEKHWSAAPDGAWTVSPQDWAAADNPDPAKVAEFQAGIIKTWKEGREKQAERYRPDHVYFYPEPHISSRLSAGNVPVSGEPQAFTPEEAQRTKMFFNTSRLAAEAVRREMPGQKVLIPWGDAGFTWPLLRQGFPKDLIDGQGVDTPGFERIPERQLHEQSIHRFYWINQEWEKFGKKPELYYCEGIFVPTEPGAVSWREQMDIYHRWTLLSMAYGVDRFYSGWFAFDCTNYYGAEHYGGCGIQDKIPYASPKPAYAAFATMTDRLNEASFDGWVPTGSLSTYALRFKKPDNKGFVYAIWTLRGKRPVDVVFEGKDPVSVVDSMNNPVKPAVSAAGGPITLRIMTDPSVVYVTTEAAAPVKAIQVGAPDNSDSQPDQSARQVADLGDGSWRFTDRKDETLENNHWGIKHWPGKFSATTTNDPTHGKVLVSKLEEKPGTDHDLMPWYNVLKPAKPITLAGAPSHLGIWAKGASDWGRVIYILRDAKGERWTSIGTKDDYNCDDPHSWSQFAYDGWRYLSFELPGHRPYDNFRRHGTTWWGAHGGAQPGTENVVDLPLALEEIIVEQRTQVLYVNDPQPPAGDTIALGKLFVEYEKPADAGDEAVRLSRLRAPLPPAPANLPNPIADLAKTGVGAPTRITKITPPEHQYDGTRAHIHFDEVPGATKYNVWVSAHADGRGAVDMAPGGIKNGQLIAGLRPVIKLYYWVTYEDAEKKISKPSPAREEVLIDAFKEK